MRQELLTGLEQGENMMNRCEDNAYYKQITKNAVASQIVRSKVLLLIHQFFAQNNFTLVDPPILHEQIANKKHEIYLALYNDRYSLNSSNALYMAAYAGFYKKVYAISATFRNEQNSINHLVEFRMLEVEMLGMTYDELPCFVNTFILYVLTKLSEMQEIKENTPFNPRIQALLEDFKPLRVSYDEFVRELASNSGYAINTGVDLSDIDYIISKHIKTPVFLMDYPRTLSTWTAKQQDNGTAFAFNLILPDSYGELCEGCERNNDKNVLKMKMKMAGIDNLQWYIDSVEQFSTSRCGFGIGVDRLIRWIVGASHIKDTVLFPRKKFE